ncbi:hypothetical protein G9X68_17840 [Rhizobium sp. WYCCWR 11279]|uniref:hypothetical protein n=1 Tax=Rhizobium changzhiense TaxID=2692317 RepID=UPI001491D501|nr:hypothetical protein [Rhizobium changzhiense]NNU48953.1 hypothetical protein [Rhizobium changzhiense]
MPAKSRASWLGLPSASSSPTGDHLADFVVAGIDDITFVVDVAHDFHRSCSQVGRWRKLQRKPRASAEPHPLRFAAKLPADRGDQPDAKAACGGRVEIGRQTFAIVVDGKSQRAIARGRDRDFNRSSLRVITG